MGEKLHVSHPATTRRLDFRGCDRPLLTATNIHYEISEPHPSFNRRRGAIHTLARQLGLVEAIDSRLHLLCIHLPYHESDHVLNIAYNPLCDGTCLQDIELRRNDQNFLNALGARRIPDPTTAGDFCRRFTRDHIYTLLDVINDTRLKAWANQPRAFFERADIDMDGTLVATTGACKHGMDIAYDGTWGYHPLIVSLANTGEVLGLVNRSGNRPSHEGAAAEVDRALDVCFRGGFRQALLRGDTDFSQTEHLDRWDDDPRVRFVFGYVAAPNLKGMAEDLPATHWLPLQRPARYEIKTQPRQRPDKVKEGIVVVRGFENFCTAGRSTWPSSITGRRLAARSTAWSWSASTSRVRRGSSSSSMRSATSFTSLNDWESTASEITFSANDRCDQENLLSQLHTGVRALKAPSDSLESNWAFMVMTALAWNPEGLVGAGVAHRQWGVGSEALVVRRRSGCWVWNSRRL